MRFKTNTVPLMNALNLGIVNSNVSKFYKPSILASVSASKNDLIINLEATRLLTEIHVSGLGSEESVEPIFVDCLKLKQLINSLDTSVVEIEFDSNGLIIHSGKSKFVLSKLIDNEVSMNRPVIIEDMNDTEKIDIDSWKFIADKQMYALSFNFVHKEYTRVWVSSDGDVIAGDYDIGIFTHSMENTLDSTCLLADTIINLLESLPEGSSIIRYDDSYVVCVSTDGYHMYSQFKPEYENQDGMGSYNSEIILGSFVEDDKHISFDPKYINKFLSQADILSVSSEDEINIKYEGDSLILKGSNVDCEIGVDGDCSSFNLDFRVKSLRTILSKYEDESVNICPVVVEDNIVGITIWTATLATTIAALD